MTPERPPHEVLGVPPGAGRDRIDEAYRRLIKQHHPDIGGDADRAKAIIHAYRSLLRAGTKVPVVVSAPPLTRSTARRWPVLVLAGASGLLLWWAPWPGPGPVVERAEPVEQAALPRAMASERAVAPLLLPRVAPDSAAVEAGVEELRRFVGAQAGQAESYSKACAADLERLPGDGLLDHCLAFDLAAAKAFPDEAWWRGAAMSARHDEAARTVLEDPVLARARIREIRRQVERQLASR